MKKFQKNFNLYASYYNLIYSKKNYKQEVTYISKLLKKYSGNKKNILEFGSGTGNHARFFVKKNYQVYGIEKSKSMLAYSKKINSFNFQLGDIRYIKLKRKFDIILSLFHVLSYQVKNKDLNNFFKNARLHLNDKGILGFDFWYTPAVKFQKPSIKMLEIKKNNLRLFRLAEPVFNYSKKLTEVKYTVILKSIKNNKINIIKENHLMRSFNLIELKKYFIRYGFKLVHAKELISNRNPSINTWSVFCLLKKF